MKLPDTYNCKVSIIGLGYVGLPLAIEISKTKKCKKTGKKIKRETIGFDLFLFDSKDFVKIHL